MESLMAEAIELHNSTLREIREMRLESEKRTLKYKEEKEEKEERDRRIEERDRKDKESQEAYRLEMAAINAHIADQNQQAKEDTRKRHKEYMLLMRKLNQRLGEISNKQGTLGEDIIAPGAIPLIRRYFKCEPSYVSQRTKQKKGHKNCEVDLMLIGQDKAFMIEVKSSPDSRDVDKILTKAKTLVDFFPNCADKQIIPMLASIVIDKSIINYANKKGLYVVAYKQWEYLDILNFKKIGPGL